LCWRKRHELSMIPWRTEWLGAVALFVLGAAWYVARATGTLVLEQFAAALTIPALVFAVLGRRALRVLAFPMLFMLLAVPAGRGIVPWLMQNTADFAAAALRMSGVPVVHDGMILSIPGGNFEVARACSGLNYLVTGIALGALYAYLTYSSTRKRVLFMLAALIVPLVLNGVRAYLIIAIAHLTDMRWGTGYEHVIFGRALFLLTMFLLFWIGYRWRDPAEPTEYGADRSSVGAEAVDASGASLAVLMAATLSIVGPPLYLQTALAHARTDLLSQGGQIELPGAADGWKGPDELGPVWKPQYSGAVNERAASYLREAGDRVDIYVGVYGLGLSAGGEMIGFGNRLTQRETESLLPQDDVDLDLPGGAVRAREFLVAASSGRRVVWRWYLVDDRPFRLDWQVKAAEALEFVTGGSASERVLMLSAPYDRSAETARAALNAFVAAHGDCIGAGFTGRECER